VTIAGGRAALDARRRQDVGRTVVVHAVTALGRIAGAGGRPALRRALGIRRTRPGNTGAVLVDVARARRGPADGGGRREDVGGARRDQAGAVLGRVAHADRGTTHGGGRERVRRTGVGDAVAALGDFAVASGRTAHGRALRVGRAGRAADAARLGRVAAAGRGPADVRRRLEGIGRAVVAAAVAVLRDVAVACR